MMNSRVLGKASARVAQPVEAHIAGRPSSLLGEGRPSSACEIVKADTTKAYLAALRWSKDVAQLTPLDGHTTIDDVYVIVAEGVRRLEAQVRLIFVVNSAKVRENGATQKIVEKYELTAVDEVREIFEERIGRHANACADQRGGLLSDLARRGAGMRESCSVTNAWLHKVGAGIDHDALDTIADTIMDGLNAMAPPSEHRVREKTMVLLKLLAIIIAALPDTDDGNEAAELASESLSGALRLEVARCRRAAKRDGFTR